MNYFLFVRFIYLGIVELFFFFGLFKELLIGLELGGKGGICLLVCMERRLFLLFR